MEKELIELSETTRKNIQFCKWVETQDFENYFWHLQEEVDELKEAIKNKDTENIKEELGDALLDMLMLIRIAERDMGIDSKQIVSGVIRKLKRRKPYIFENRSVSLEEGRRIWYSAKSKEKNKQGRTHKNMK